MIGLMLLILDDIIIFTLSMNLSQPIKATGDEGRDVRCDITSHSSTDTEMQRRKLKKETHIWRCVQQVSVDHHRRGVGLRREVHITGQRHCRTYSI